MKYVQRSARRWGGIGWMKKKNLPPRAVIEQCYRALGEPIPNEFAARLGERGSPEN